MTTNALLPGSDPRILYKHLGDKYCISIMIMSQAMKRIVDIPLANMESSNLAILN